MLVSTAVLVTVNNARALTVLLVTAGRNGAMLTSYTVITKLFVTVKGGWPLSVTASETRFVEGLWNCAGVQLSVPVFELTVRPAGPEISVQLRICAGWSAS